MKSSFQSRRSFAGKTLEVSVIVSTYAIERLDDVLCCISSVKNQSLKPFEVILVLDPDKKLLQTYRSRVPHDVRIVVSDHLGLSYARNAGVREARGEIVAFIDDDAAADKKWLEKLISNYSDPSVMGVGGNVIPVWESNRPFWFPEELDWIVGCSYKGLPERRSTVRNPIGCNMSYRRKVFVLVGYFESDIGRSGNKLVSKEETEFSIRVLNKIPNSRMIFEPSSIVCHKVNKSRQDLKYIWRRSFYEGVSKVLIDSKSTSHVGRSTENAYLEYLMKVAIPSRFRRIFRLDSICQLFTLFLSMSGVLTGFLLAKIERSW